MRALVVGVVCLGVVACASPTTSPSNAGGPAPTPAITTSAPSMVPPSPSPSAAVSPTAASTTVTVPLGGTHAVVATIEDASGLLVSARPMVWTPAIPIPASYGDRGIAAWTRSGKPDAEVWLYWGGVICDTTSQLVIGPGATTITMTEGPRPACDASNDGRGLVLTFVHPIDATTIAVIFVMAQPSP